MERPKIKEISSYEYPSGRIDKFEIEISANLHQTIVEFLSHLEFSEESLEDFDIEFESFRGYIFGYSKKIKVHLFVYNEGAVLVLDSSEDKKKIIEMLEKFFVLFKEREED